MHLIVALRWPASPEVAGACLARHLKLSPYEARGLVAGEPPKVVAAVADAQAAASIAQALNADGFLTALLPGDQVERDAQRDCITSMEFGDAALQVKLRQGETTLAYDDVDLLVQGVRVSTVSTTTKQTDRKLNLGRAVLTSGLVISKTETKVTTKSAETREGFLYLCPRGGRTLALYERQASYACLGAAVQPSSFANFTAAVAELRRRLPNARWDGRLTRPAGLGVMPMAPPGVDAGEWRSDVGVAVVCLALGSGR
jgi:hypothetical protein